MCCSPDDQRTYYMSRMNVDSLFVRSSHFPFAVMRRPSVIYQAQLVNTMRIHQRTCLKQRARLLSGRHSLLSRMIKLCPRQPTKVTTSLERRQKKKKPYCRSSRATKIRLQLKCNRRVIISGA